MKRLMVYSMVMIAATGAAAWAGEATSSAGAGSGRDGRGWAEAAAAYRGGGMGIAKADTHTGAINFGHGWSVGFDGRGLSLSSSFALAGKSGPAVGRTTNLHIGLDGTVSHGSGSVVAQGGAAREVTAGGAAGAHRSGPIAIANVGGRTTGGGRVEASAHTRTAHPTIRDLPGRPVRLVRR
ncbi:MAG: hypothetical protein C4547_14180 [Phycisphaerales bacterium]|nr:MAG: hypothetical protein C4547_14180 [Phycisphaerales bacterium]